MKVEEIYISYDDFSVIGQVVFVKSKIQDLKIKWSSASVRLFLNVVLLLVYSNSYLYSKL